MKISKYIRKLNFNSENYLLRNLFNGAIYLVPKSDFEEIEHSLHTGHMPHSRHLADLQRECFIVTDELTPKYSRNADSFLVTIETTSDCNLRCSYCYENDKGSRPAISSEVIFQTLNYIENVFIQDATSKSLCVGFIGGEPLLCKEKVKFICNKVSILGSRYNREIHFHIDTNGTIPFDDLYSTINNLHVSVSLTPKYDHNKNRSGKGFDSYEQIIKNLRTLSYKEGNSLSIRYNTNDENIGLFEGFVAFVKANIPICSVIEPMYTDEYDHAEFRNKLKLEDFRNWNSSEAIDILINQGFQIPYTLGGVFNPCMAYQDYSCKVYSDGMVTLCDSMFHCDALCNIAQICDNPSLLDKYFSLYKHYNPLNDDCRDCVELARCCGKIFCRTDKCNYSKRFNDDLLAAKFVSCFLNGKGEFFPNML